MAIHAATAPLLEKELPAIPPHSHSRDSSLSSLASVKILNIVHGGGPLSSNPPPKKLTVKTVRFSKPNPMRSMTAPPRLTKQHSVKRDTGTYTATTTFTIPIRPQQKRYTTITGAPKFLPLGEERKSLLDKALPAPPVVVEIEPENEKKQESPTALPKIESPVVTEETEAMTREFDGDLETNNALPSRSTLQSCRDIPIFDSAGEQRSFGSLWDQDADSQKRVMVIFIRHFFCGNCQEYIRTLSAQLPSTSLPPNTSIAVIGCGAPSLIPTYSELTSSPYPIYADPSRRLYSLLGMTKTLSLGRKDPEYIQHSLVVGAWQSIVQGLKRVGEGDVLKAGDMRQVGGEFLIQPGGKVSWCHRMRNTRDHAEIRELKKVLGVAILDEPSATPATVTPAAAETEKPLLERKPSATVAATAAAARRPPQRRWTTSTIARSISRTSQHWVEKKAAGVRASSRTRSRSRSRSESAGVQGQTQMQTPPRLGRRASRRPDSRDGKAERRGS